MAIYQLNSLGLVTISGNDSTKLLQGQITTNPDNISEDEFSLSAICNPQGRCIAVFWIKKHSDNFQLIMPADNIENFSQHLKKYAVFYKVEISSPQSQILGTLAFHDSQENISFFPLESEKTQACMALVTDDASSDIEYMSEENWFADIAKNKICWINGDASSEFLPHNIDLPELGAIDFKKGCFTGQEVIARMQYKGKLKSHLQLMVGDDIGQITPKRKVFSGDTSVGEVVCGVTDEAKKSYLLTILKDKSLEEKNFRLSSENGPILKLS